MPKISALPEVAQPTGTETVVVMSGERAARVSMRPLVAAALGDELTRAAASADVSQVAADLAITAGRVYATKADAVAAQPDDGAVMILADESRDGARTLYRAAGGALSFAGVMIGAADLADPAKGADLIGLSPGRTVRDALVLPDGRVLSDPILSQALERLRREADRVLTVNVRPADRFTPYDRIGPGDGYTETGQWAWDTPFEAVAAVALGRAEEAQRWLLNLPAAQLDNGMTPCTIGPGLNTNYSQVPVRAWATWECFNATGDLVFARTMYDYLVREFAWWKAARMDASGLFLYGSSRPGSPSPGLVAQDLRYETGEDANIGFFDAQFAGVDGMLADHVCPELNAALASEAGYMAKLADALGLADQRDAWAGTRDGINGRIARYLWDDQYGRLAMIVRSDLARSVGTLAAPVALGATSLTLAEPIGFAAIAGDKLVLGDTTVQLAADLVGTETVLRFMRGIDTAFAAGTSVFHRGLQWCHKLTHFAFPLFAGSVTQAQARRMVDENLLYRFDGDVPDKFTAYLGTDYGRLGSGRTSRLKARHLFWHAPDASGATTITARGWRHDYTSGDRTVLTIYARGMASDPVRPLAAIVPEWETAQRYRPLSIDVRHPRAAASQGYQLLLGDYPANAFVVNTELPMPAGVDGAFVTTTLDPLTTSARPFYARLLQRSNATADLATSSVTLTFHVRGFVYATGLGLIAQPRLTDDARATEVDSDVHDGGNSPATSDYWKGDHWVNLEFLTILGLLRYGMRAEAELIGRQVIDRVYREFVATGRLWERFSMRGQGKGAPDYGWTANVINIAQVLGWL
ncbi:hypothetical protein [uncultured Sphingomonas sp.]|uniref:MGH1-like glycoside hydrolase domain-containing protein n=1 Tax=uncultured Sphingomonas sp. TaxID=158754 RepID=UPI0025CFBF85|nr:hypothetical protein [uncultured Sphingomonas sp.]